ncbi:MAG: manganese efflux pump [Clostridia bacterium]|nr:manganese efflux pump [Clostridia bacterium]
MIFILTSVLFGIGLAMDAFSVSAANGIRFPHMPAKRSLTIAGAFGLFQTFMPLLGWLCVHAVAEAFTRFQRFIPWIALLLLLYIGGKMIWEGLRGEDGKAEDKPLGGTELLIQSVATSIDALSVGFTISEYRFAQALAESAIIGAVTFAICMAGLYLGKRIGARLAGKASLVGGLILIAIGIKIWAEGVL